MILLVALYKYYVIINISLKKVNFMLMRRIRIVNYFFTS